MVLTAAASKSGDDTILPGEQRSVEKNPVSMNASHVTESPEQDDDSFESFEPATHKSIMKETKPTKHYHIRRKQNHGQKSSKHKSTTTISPKLMNYYNMKNDYY